MEQLFSFSYAVLNSEKELPEKDFLLLLKAREAATVAYAPYSGFQVGAAAMLINDKIVTGSNQENASYPAGMCAERSLLASSAQLYPNVAIDTMAISYMNMRGSSEAPVTPCGFCRQVLTEFENRVHQPIRLIICGLSGLVYIIPQSAMLLPLSFTAENLK